MGQVGTGLYCEWNGSPWKVVINLTFQRIPVALQGEQTGGMRQVTWEALGPVQVGIVVATGFAWRDWRSRPGEGPAGR